MSFPFFKQSDCKNFGIYVIINLVDNKVYIGSTIRNFRKRWREHRDSLKDGNHRNTHLQRAWNKYGEENFEFQILEKLEDRTDISLISKREEFWITSFGSFKSENGYNIDVIVGGRKAVSEETRAKISKANSGRKCSPEAKEKIVKTLKSLYQDGVEKPWNKGLKMSEQFRETARLSHIGLKHKPETIEKIRSWNIGKVVSSETKQKISSSKKGIISKSRKFKPDEVLNILNERKSGLGCIAISKKYNVSVATIKRICNRTYYKEISDV